MTKFMYSLYDLKAKLYSNPFYQLSDVLAMRDLARAVNAADSEIAANPEDFVLFVVARFDDETGVIEPFDFIQLCVATELLAK